MEGKNADNTYLLTQLMPTLSGSDAGIKQRRNAACGRKLLERQSAVAGQSGSAWAVSPSARPVPTTSGEEAACN